uniref:hypothetical protein n=1 Tax=Pedobacter sp. TaxID=1411316 RepID=UPI003D7FD13D
MKDQDIYAELSSIRNLMERSTKFISLSGLSGVLAGIYALIGAYVGYKLIYAKNSGLHTRDFYVNDPQVIWNLVIIALAVLILSIATCIFLSHRQALKKHENFWNPVSKRLLVNMAVPLVTGGLLISIFIFRGYFGVIASACLIFYGLALVAGSQFTFSDVKWLGFCEIVLGL